MNLSTFTSLAFPDLSDLALCNNQVILVKEDDYVSTGLTLPDFIRNRIAFTTSKLRRDQPTISLPLLKVLASKISQADFNLATLPSDTVMAPPDPEQLSSLVEITPDVQCGVGDCECYSQGV
jgi:hypothetical protein